MSGGAWSFIEMASRQGLQLLIYVVMARLLTPEAFGLIGMTAIFMALSQSVVMSGFGQALIQKQDTTIVDESTVFYFNIVAGIVMCCGLSLAAPWIADFYGEPLLTPVTRVFSISLIINSFGIVQNALLMKEVRFKTRAYARIPSVVISGIVGITMAYMSFGVWAIIAQFMVMNFCFTVGLWILHPWRPVLRFSFSSFRTLWGFGSKLLLSGLLNTIFLRGYSIIIGKLYAARELGFYQNAKELVAVCSQMLSSVVAQVNFPLMAKIQDEPERMRLAFSRVLKITMLLISPIMVGLCIVAPNLILVVLGEKWSGSILYIQILCFTGLLYPIHMLNLSVLQAQGRSDLFLRLEIIKKVITVLCVLASFRYGVIGLLMGQCVSSTIGLTVNTFYTKKSMDAGLIMQLRWLAGISYLPLAMGVVVALAYFTGLPRFYMLAVQVLSGIAVYALLFILAKDADIIAIRSAVSNKVTNSWRHYRGQ